MVIWDRNLTLPKVGRQHDAAQADSAVVLTVGDTSNWVDRGRLVADDRKITYVDFVEVTPDMIRAIGPEAVISPLLATTFDCIDLACVLQEAGFTGKYRALSRKIPNPKLVLREIKEICPDVDFDLIFVDGIDTPSAYA